MGNFTIVNGQLYTPGLAIVDAPQPSTPLGGGKSTFNLPKLPLTEPANLQVAIDVSGNGALPWPPSTQSANSPTLFHNITLFLTSESKSQNFTISNGTVPATNTTGFVGPVLDLEPSSTVKHVNWIWPECLVGTNDGIYNISMHQSFRWNGTDYYTVFNWPISLTNSIPESSDRVGCGLLENLVKEGESSDSLSGQPWLTGSTNSSNSSGSTVSVQSMASVKRGKLAIVGSVLALFWLIG